MPRYCQTAQAHGDSTVVGDKCSLVKGLAAHVAAYSREMRSYSAVTAPHGSARASSSAVARPASSAVAPLMRNGTRNAACRACRDNKVCNCPSLDALSSHMCCICGAADTKHAVLPLLLALPTQAVQQLEIEALTGLARRLSSVIISSATAAALTLTPLPALADLVQVRCSPTLCWDCVCLPACMPA